jgi:hypothetical protein
VASVLKSRVPYDELLLGIEFARGPHAHHLRRPIENMKEYATQNLRNVALIAHQGAGKTSLAEALLFNAGAVNRIGEVTQGNTVSDFE